MPINNRLVGYGSTDTLPMLPASLAEQVDAKQGISSPLECEPRGVTDEERAALDK